MYGLESDVFLAKESGALFSPYFRRSACAWTQGRSAA